MFQTKLYRIIPEGTIETGDVIAELDREPLSLKLSELTLNLQDQRPNLLRLRSIRRLSAAREDVRAAEDGGGGEETSQRAGEDEAPSIKRQAEIDYEKAGRALEQSKRNLETKKRQATATMFAMGAEVAQQRNQVLKLAGHDERLYSQVASLRMVIYLRE